MRSLKTKKLQNNKFIYILLLIVVLIGVSIVLSTNLFQKYLGNKSEVNLVVYNNGLAVVSEKHAHDFKKGINEIFFSGLPERIIPESVMLSGDGLRVSEQSYEYSLADKYSLLKSYIGKNITAYQITGDEKRLVEGTLLALNGDDIVMKTKAGISIFKSGGFELPGSLNLFTRPTLHWLIYSSDSGSKSFDLVYQTKGISWKADYVGILNNKEDLLKLDVFATITNNAGKSYDNATLTLVAGQLNVPYTPRPVYVNSYLEKSAVASAVGGMSDETSISTLSDYYKFKLNRKVSINNNQQKQLGLINAESISIKKSYVFEHYYSDTPVGLDLVYEFENSEKNNLGKPLPAGTIKIYKKQDDGLFFLGEAPIKNTALNEVVKLNVGKAFDVKGTKIQENYNRISDNIAEYTYNVTIFNHKKSGITATIYETPAGDWEIRAENYKHIKESQHKIKWLVPVKAESNTTLSYTIRYYYG